MTSCTLCDLPVRAEGVSDGDETFCCPGCREVYNALGDVDTESSRQEEWTTEEMSVPEDATTTHLTVDGMHCSACELYLERLATRTEGVYHASASYATEAVRVNYDPAEVDSDTIADTLTGMGYTASDRTEDRDGAPDAASRLLVGGIFGMMVMTWYAVFLYPGYFGYDPVVSLGAFDSAYLYGQIAVMSAVVLLYTGRPILRGAYVSLRSRRPNVDLLVAIAAAAAYLYSTATLLTGGLDLYYDVTIVVVMAVTIGSHYESRIKERTTGLLSDLTELQVDQATRQDGESVSVEAIDAGDELRVRPGERIPVDGTVQEGTAAVDEALVTGESLPVRKEPGDTVRGGTIVTDEAIVVAAGADATSTLDRVVDLLWDIQAARPGAQRVADRLATVFVPLVLGLAILVGVGLFVTGSRPQTAILAGLTVLIVSCPCALGLATPLAVARGLKAAAQRGIVVTTPALFEFGADIDTIVLDKTGTVTDGSMAVTDVSTTGPATPAEVLFHAAALEQHSTHPVATAVTEAARTRTLDETLDGDNQVDIATVDQYRRGLSGTVSGTKVDVGHPDLIRERHDIPDDFDEAISEARSRGDIPVIVAWGDAVRGVLTVGDELRDGWQPVVASLGQRHRVVVLTGDDGPAAAQFREHPAIDEVFAGVPPEGKAETVRRLQATDTVAMVGDGSNDAPALAAADLGIALEGGTQLASDAADAVVLDDRFDRIPAVLSCAGGTRSRIRENLAWAFVYNGVAIPLAVVGLINPLFAAVAMASSSLLVVANSARDPLSDPVSSDGSSTSRDTETAEGSPTVPRTQQPSQQ